MGPLGYTCKVATDDMLGFGDSNGTDFWVARSARPVPADRESGLHFCFTAPSKEAVARFHQAAMETGGTDNGPPGLRPNYGEHYYAAFVIDPEGYRLEAYHDDAVG